MTGRFFSAEADLIISSLAPSSAFMDVSEGYLFAIQSPSMRKYRIRRNLIIQKTLQAGSPMVIEI